MYKEEMTGDGVNVGLKAQVMAHMEVRHFSIGATPSEVEGFYPGKLQSTMRSKESPRAWNFGWKFQR
jgi:hypothetical protein